MAPSLAIETSKRKFHKLLENLTAAPSSGTDTSPAAKRARLTPRSTLPHTSLARRPALVPGVPGTTPVTIPARKEPNYAPYSQDAFRARLKTFADLRHWTSKPERINDVAWAKRGWSLETSQVNYVACKGGCEAHLLVRLRPERQSDEGESIPDSEDFTKDVDEALVEKYAGLIAEGHHEGCLWRDAGCGDAVQRIRIARPAVWIPELKARYDSLASMEKLPPEGAVTVPAGLDLQVAEAQLPDEIWAKTGGDSSLEIPEKRPPLNKVALAFALTGWEAAQKAGNYPLATCTHCFRRVGLWLYADSPIDESSMKLDLLQNHRDWCPWINGKSQHMPGAYAGLAAWEILLRCISNHASFDAKTKALDGPQERELARNQSDKENGVHRPERREDADVDKQDKIRFARLKQLTSSIGLRTWKRRARSAKSV